VEACFDESSVFCKNIIFVAVEIIHLFVMKATRFECSVFRKTRESTEASKLSRVQINFLAFISRIDDFIETAKSSQLPDKWAKVIIENDGDYFVD